MSLSPRTVGALSGVIGAAAAVVTVLVWSLVNRPSVPKAQPIAERTAGGDSGTQLVVQRVDELRLAELERQLEELKVERASESTDRTPREPRDPEEVRRRFEERLVELDQRHQEEGADPTWAPGAESGLFAELADMGVEYGFSIAAAECKTTMCRASLTWPNYQAARKTVGDLAERSFSGLNCARAVSYAEPEDRAAPYGTELYLDCTEMRAGLVEVNSSRE